VKQGYECARCGVWIEFSAYVRAMMVGERAVADRCSKCGAVHAVHHGEVEVISRPMFPITHDAGVVSPWMLRNTRPVRAGAYECKFSDVDGILVLWWDGGGFKPSERDTRYVQMQTFTTWRGIWG
jgi:hypothetical protein